MYCVPLINPLNGFIYGCLDFEAGVLPNIPLTVWQTAVIIVQNEIHEGINFVVSHNFPEMPQSSESTFKPCIHIEYQFFVLAQNDKSAEWENYKLNDKRNNGQTRAKPRGNNGKRNKYCCKYCKSNKETAAYFKSHDVTDENGMVTCPVLMKLVCPICQATGPYSHTLKRCPLSQTGKGFDPHVPYPINRTATGKLYTRKY